MDNLETLILTYTSKTLEIGQSGMDNLDTDIDIHKKKTLEIVQLCMDNLQTLTLTYTRIRR